MKQHNLTDLIESYIKDALKDELQIDIRRQDIADQFHCVPSQINYVIKTRFTSAQGYQVESKRGGGGYIRIQRVIVSVNDHCQYILEQLPDTLTYQSCQAIIEQLSSHQLLNIQSSDLLLTMLDPKVLGNDQQADCIRAAMMTQCIKYLQYHQE